jgi:hypothetical protein
MSEHDVKAEPTLTALERKWAQEAADREQTLTDAYKEGSLDVEKIPESVLDRIPKPTGWRIVILPYRGSAKSKGGILLADQTIEKITVATTCGYVLSVGRWPTPTRPSSRPARGASPATGSSSAATPARG